jgi:hypothetical protein
MGNFHLNTVFTTVVSPTLFLFAGLSKLGDGNTPDAPTASSAAIHIISLKRKREKN